jgi:hypothetical protein
LAAGLGLIEDADQRGLGDPQADERHVSALTHFGDFVSLGRSRAGCAAVLLAPVVAPAAPAVREWRGRSRSGGGGMSGV